MALLLLLAASASAQHISFSGRIIDARTDRPIAGATITLAGLPGTVKSDADGRFEWTPRPPVPVQLIVVLPGGEVASPVTIEGDEPAPHVIRVSPLAGESLTVIGVAPSVNVAPAAATTLLPSAHIAARAPEHLLQALETIPGVSAASEGHAAVPAIRGLARGRTVILIDGARVSAERRVGPSATFSDPATFEGIDVARGPGSVAYGSDAFGGVISIRTRRAAPGSPLRVRGVIGFGAGTPERRLTGEVSQGLARGGVLVQVHARDADEWASPETDEGIPNSGWRDGGVLARLEHEVGAGLFSFGVQTDFARDVGRPRNNSRAVRFFYPHEDSHRVTAAYETGGAGFHRVAVSGFFGVFRQRTDQDQAATATSARSVERADISARDFHVTASGVRRVGGARLEVGADVNGRLDLDAVDSRIRYIGAGQEPVESASLSIDSARRTDAGVYIQTEAAATRAIRWSAGLRIDRIGTRVAGGYFGERSTSHTSISGFASATLTPVPGLSLTGQVARGFRDPMLSDRYYRGPTGRGFATGNPDLQPETSFQLDAAVHYRLGRTRLAAYAYQYRIDDLVERYSTALDDFFFRNRRRARLRGVEVEASTELGRGVSLQAGAAVGRGIALEDGTALDDVGADAFTMLVRKDLGPAAFVQARGAFWLEDTRPGPGEVRAPGATVIDIAAGRRLSRHLELRGVVRNLLDDAYYASPDPTWVWAPGRSGMLTLVLQMTQR